ncbi:helix-turn-helix domain-containing protein [Spiroplasma apis]|uniref:Insertion element IS150 protein InsJ-like helix-turn-helix domain-containing protein n=1 Tax=Spiroplasma apis B31 TaxID=1276258 RepID=V5RIL5_SPIAP|nr:helix-turn-helix domain-containing protein [Spiroplasma apis]AHB36323.1 hypothetical protein SAPIS_v1c04780 [Spiroplasma apis B31]
MANLKGNKSNILNFETKKELIIKHFDKNLSYKDLSKMYNISYSTVRRMCVDWEVFGDESLTSKTGKHNKHNGKIRINSKDPKDKKIAELNKKLKWLEMENEVFKKSSMNWWRIQKKIITYYKTKDKYNSKYTVLSLCKLFNVTRASYYRWCCKINRIMKQK